jgi:hypothetical protein
VTDKKDLKIAMKLGKKNGIPILKKRYKLGNTTGVAQI